jgi:hypothetical protein
MLYSSKPQSPLSSSHTTSLSSDFIDRFTYCSASVRESKSMVRCFALPVLVTGDHKQMLKHLCKELHIPLITNSVTVAAASYALRVTCEIATGGDFLSTFAATKAVMAAKSDKHENTCVSHFSKVAFCFLVLIKPNKNFVEPTNRTCLDVMNSDQPIPHCYSASEFAELTLLKQELDKSRGEQDPQVVAVVERRLNTLMRQKKRFKPKMKSRKPLSYMAIGIIVVGVLVTLIFVGSISIYAGQTL